MAGSLTPIKVSVYLKVVTTLVKLGFGQVNVVLLALLVVFSRDVSGPFPLVPSSSCGSTMLSFPRLTDTMDDGGHR